MEEAISSGPKAAGGPVGNTIDLATVDVRPAVREAMAAGGFHPRDTGGGCMAWNRRAGEDTHVMVSSNGRLDGDPDRAEWAAGRYGDKGGFIEVAGLTLQEALDAVATLPMPVRVDGSLAEAVYPSLEEAMSDFA